MVLLGKDLFSNLTCSIITYNLLHGDQKVSMEQNRVVLAKVKRLILATQLFLIIQGLNVYAAGSLQYPCSGESKVQ